MKKPKYKYCGTETGRFTSAQPNVNLTNMPKLDRKLFVPDPTPVFIEVDLLSYDPDPVRIKVTKP